MVVPHCGIGFNLVQHIPGGLTDRPVFTQAGIGNNIEKTRIQ